MPSGLITINKLNIARFLLDKQFDPNSEERSTGAPFIQVATKYNNPKMVKLLLEYGANPNKGHGASGQTALHLAAGNGNLAITQILLKKGAQQIASWYVTPLYSDIAQLLLDNGARINQRQTDTNNTPFHAATRADKLGTVKLLVNREADLFAKNNTNQTPLDVATSNDVKQYLQKRMAESPEFEAYKRGRTPEQWQTR